MNRLKDLRTKHKLTQQQTADIAGVTRRGYQKWESGESSIKADKAQILADYFGVPVAYLLGYHEETISFTFPNDDEGFYKETQKLIDIADNIDPNSEIYSQVQQVKDMAILAWSSREKIKARYGQKVYAGLNDKETDFEFYQYLGFLLNKEEYLKSDLLVYLSLLDSSDKEIVFKMITEFKK
ncbi:helix-turn-helix domain-containing protein [Streptococcus suis]|uniref:helix-turn-helix domain-containing protein n=1 Tax=Streptococcus suis TaxID=1307 RepID=UPI00403D73C8